MFTTVVVAHTARQAMADSLAADVGAAHVCLDDGTLGAEHNHRRAWDWHNTHTRDGFALVLEDDAVPVPGFRDQLTAALDAAPAPIVSLYLGTGHPRQHQPLIERAIVAAGHDVDWLIADHLLHAVAVAIRADLLPIALDDRPTDEAISAWARARRHPIAYCWSSLVDHADEPSVITARADHRTDTRPRRAWHAAPHQHWSSRSAVLC